MLACRHARRKQAAIDSDRRAPAQEWCLLKINALETLRLSEFPNLLWTRIFTDEGYTGIGETFYGAEAVEACGARQNESGSACQDEPGAVTG